MWTAEAVNLISHYTACLIAVIGSSFPCYAAEGTLSPDPTLPSGVRRVLYYYHQEESPDNPCVSVSVCLCVCVCVWVKRVCVRPLYLPIGNVRNCNFSFYCCGIIKWQEYLMQLYANCVMCESECVFNGFLWLAHMARTAVDRWCTCLVNNQTMRIP